MGCGSDTGFAMQQAIWLHASALTNGLPQAIGIASAGVNCAPTSKTLNKMAKNRFTMTLQCRRCDVNSKLLFGCDCGVLDFLQVFGRVFVEVSLAHRAAEFDFLSLIHHDVRLAHVAAQLVAGNRTCRQQIRLDDGAKATKAAVKIIPAISFKFFIRYAINH
jgi:hypothetical protein